MQIQQLCEEYQEESAEKVLYLSQSELEHYKVTFENGAAMTGRLNSPLYSDKPYFREPQVIFALIIPVTNNPEQNLYAIQLRSKLECTSDKYIHHSSISAGGPVLFAASIQTDQFGMVTYIANDSGHYKPSLKSFIDGIKHLLSIGANLSNAKFLLYDKAEDRLKPYKDSDVFLTLYIRGGFDSVNYAGEVDSIDNAIQELNSKPTAHTKVYFIKERCDLYEFDHLKSEFISFTQKYQEIEKTPAALIQKTDRELRYHHYLQEKQQADFLEKERLALTNSFTPTLQALMDKGINEEEPGREYRTPPQSPKKVRMVGQ